jgi:hypothetical protein
LIDESDAASIDPLDEVRTKLMKLYEDRTARPRSIGATVDKFASEHKTAFGHRAEFWLLLSLGEALAHPTQTYGHNAGNYRHRALLCDDISNALILKYGKLIGDLLPVRSHPSDVRAHIASIWAKRQYDELANRSVHTP